MRVWQLDRSRLFATGKEDTLVKRLGTIESALRQANRAMDPMSGQILEVLPGFDPRLLPHAEWPVSPMVQEAIAGTVSEAIARNLSLRDATARVLDVLESFGIVMSPDDLRTITGIGALQAI